MRLDYLARHRKPKSGSTGAIAGKGLEQIVAYGLGDAISGVRYRHAQRVIAPRHRDLDLSSSGCVLQRIDDQIIQHPSKLAGVEPRGGNIACAVQLDTGCVRSFLESI